MCSFVAPPTTNTHTHTWGMLMCAPCYCKKLSLTPTKTKAETVVVIFGNPLKATLTRVTARQHLQPDQELEAKQPKSPEPFGQRDGETCCST